jgi:hypothetical protein
MSEIFTQTFSASESHHPPAASFTIAFAVAKLLLVLSFTVSLCLLTNSPESFTATLVHSSQLHCIFRCHFSLPKSHDSKTGSEKFSTGKR